MYNTFLFRYCYVQSTPSRLDTIFWDDRHCPVDLTLATPESLAIAAQCGYGTDVHAMRYEHEIACTFLAQERGWDYSPTLRRVALGESSDHERDEEATVLAFQTYLNTGRMDPILNIFEDVARLASVFRTCYRA